MDNTRATLVYPTVDSGLTITLFYHTSSRISAASSQCLFHYSLQVYCRILHTAFSDHTERTNEDEAVCVCRQQSPQSAPICFLQHGGRRRLAGRVDSIALIINLTTRQTDRSLNAAVSQETLIKPHATRTPRCRAISLCVATARILFYFWRKKATKATLS